MGSLWIEIILWGYVYFILGLAVFVFVSALRDLWHSICNRTKEVDTD